MTLSKNSPGEIRTNVHPIKACDMRNADITPQMSDMRNAHILTSCVKLLLARTEWGEGFPGRPNSALHVRSLGLGETI